MFQTKQVNPIFDLVEGATVLKRLLGRKRVLLILDDVDQLNQLEYLAGNPNWFGSGSRVLITTRNEHLLIQHEVERRLKAGQLNYVDSLKLFSKKAFKKDYPEEDFLGLSKSVVSYVEGLPLALEVLGSFLYGRDLSEWNNAVSQLGRVCISNIFHVLKRSYTDLDSDWKKIFLDIACFFNGHEKDRVTEVLNCCDVSAVIGIKVLMERSLVTLSNGRLWMHNLLREMGHQIVRLESLNEPGKRSRLWLHEDVKHVLTRNTGTEAMEGIFVDSTESGVEVTPKSFSMMQNLRYLKIKNGNLPKGLEYLPNSLRILDWTRYPLKSLPADFNCRKLFELTLCHSCIKILRMGTEPLYNLKIINLSHSLNLVSTPNFRVMPYLEFLYLEGCTKLNEIDTGIEVLERLTVLNLKDCQKLVCLPSNIGGLKSLKDLNLSGCSKLEKLPDEMRHVACLEKFDVSGTGIREVPSFIGLLNNLKELSFAGCKAQSRKSWNIMRLKPLQLLQRSHIPAGLTTLACLSGLCSLTRLNLSDRNLSEEAMPSDFGCLASLKQLYLRNNQFVRLPESIVRLPRLKYLELDGCRKLQILPELASDAWVEAKNCTSLQTVGNQIGQSISNMSSQFGFSSSWKYDVFLSYRGLDTRFGFTGHLYKALVQRGVNTFRDGDELEKGDKISQQLHQAIEASKSCLIVFSENYASSKWCLDELAHILECRRSKHQMVVPIFYKVHHSDVRHQRGAIGEAFAEHDCEFKDDKDKVSRWRAALSEAADISGFHFSGGYESEFIENIVKKISAHVKKPIFLDMPKYQVGLDSRVEQMLDMLDVGGSDVRMVGIWGCGGIGKTTIAKAVYNSIAHKFDGSCFLANVREGSKQHGGLVNLQEIILSNILLGREVKVADVNKGIQMLHDSLRFRKFLLVVDDVDTFGQLENLAGRTDWFGCGSRIIITARHKHLLTGHAVNSIYKAKELDFHEGLELFSSVAFKNKRILNDDDKFLISTAVGYTQGHPLALVSLGSNLRGIPIHQWQDLLYEYGRNPSKGITEILKVSIDGLKNAEKSVFLDIVCFYKGMDTNDVIQLLEVCGHDNAKKSIKILEEKALIYIGEYGRICMHDLLEEMGKYIVRQESIEPGERSRLWYHEDVVHVGKADYLSNGLWLYRPKIKCMQNLTSLSLSECQLLEEIPDLSGSPNLEFLDLSGCIRLKEVHPSVGSLQNLKSLCLSECQLLEEIPDLSGSQNLEFLDLSGCIRLKEVHPSVGSLQNLKSLCLSECQLLEEIPDLSGSPFLEELDLSFCTSLLEVHPSVQSLELLVHPSVGSLEWLVHLYLYPNHKLLENVKWRYHKGINLDYCRRLQSFPEIMGEMNRPDFPSCRMLKSFPQIVPAMENITLLDLSATAIKELPSSISYLRSLEELVLKECEHLTNLPTNVYELQHLWRLDLQNCSKLVAFPDWSSESHQIESMTSPNLWHLNLCGCKRLEEIPELPPTVKWINVADCLQLKKFMKLSNILENKDKEPEMIKCITMYNCQTLSGSLALEIAKKGNLLLNDVSLCSLFLSCKQSEFDIVFPGSEVPQWFSGRKDLTELSGELETYFKIPSNVNLVNKGFAICAAAATVENFKPEGAEIMQQSYFTATIGINGNKIVTRSFYFEAKDIILAHMWLCYIPFVKFVSYHVPDFTCKISLKHSSQGSMRIKSFGVHLVFPDKDENEDEDEDEDEDENEDENEDEDEDDDSGREN